jgi:hypothetical protein
MTFRPAALTTLGEFLVSRGVVNLGVVGDAKHAKKGVSYHLGRDQLAADAYSARTVRDKAGLSDAASAIDVGKVGGTFEGLRALTAFLFAQCRAGAPDTADIREVIGSLDGKEVLGWSDLADHSKLIPGYGDKTHRTHTHISFYRDSETRDKVALFRRYFEEGDVRITAIKGEDWKPSLGASGASNGVLRATPDRAAAVMDRIAAETVVRSIAEVSANGENWRLTEHLGQARYMLRSDWTPLVPGGDPAVDARLTEYIERTAG